MKSAAKLVFALLFAVGLCTASVASAEEVWKYDDGPEDLGQLQGAKMHPQYAHPGFVAQEAWGAIFRPKETDYPVTIKAVDLVMAAASSASDPAKMTVNATIEFYNSKEDGPDPKSKPIWTVSTHDFFNPVTAKPGTPIQGNTVMKFEFSSSKPGDKPPVITSGNIWVIIRVTSNATDTSVYWGKLDCAKISLGGQELGCGCQDLAALTDTATTPKTQIMNIIWPLGACSGSKAWKYVEDINNGTIQMKGDFRVRLRVDGGGGSSSGSSSGGTSDGGSSSGTNTDAGTTVDTTPAPTKPVVNLVTPSQGSPDAITAITIIGSGFEAGATVTIGTKKASVDSVSPTQIKANVLPGLSPGAYPVLVENTNGQVGFKDPGFTVTKPVDVDAGTTADAGSGPLKVDEIVPSSVDCTEDTEVTIYGSGFTPGMTATVDGTALLAVNVDAGGHKAQALVPKGLDAGTHSLIVKVGDTSAAKAKALSVQCGDIDASDTASVGAAPVIINGKSGGCVAAPSPVDTSAMWLLALCAALAVAMRRRRLS